ncbi:MAG: hypothetical protein AB7O37_01030 [Vicinamibacteria bacterium]
MRRRAALELLAFAALAAAGLELNAGRQAGGRWLPRLGALPGYDTYVYVAMAEQPRVFTTPPWGFRLLTPLLVHALPVHQGRGFRLVTWSALGFAAVCLGLFLRRAGFPLALAATGVAIFALAPPAGLLLANPFLVDPVTVALAAGFLLAVQAQAGLGTLALLAALGTLSKELTLVLLPAVFFARREERGVRGALRDALLVAAPCCLLLVSLRAWAPWAGGPRIALDLDALRNLLAALAVNGGDWLLFGGLGPLALLGALSPATRPLLRSYGVVLLVLLALPFLYTLPYPASTVFLAGDLPRYAVYPLLLLLPLALSPLRRLLRAGEAPVPGHAPRAALQRALYGLALALSLLPLALDPYRRAELDGRVGARLLDLVRKGRGAAEALAGGRQVVLDAGETSAWARQDELVYELGWFFGRGWSLTPERAVRMAAPEAVLLVPLLAPRALGLELELEADTTVPLTVALNGAPVGRVPAGPGGVRSRLRLPARALFRGDNLLTLTREDATEVRFHAATLRP